MKQTISAPNSVPRLNSLLHRLQQTPGPEEVPYLDQLMMFLDDPPDGVTNRWEEGAKMCAAWGISTTDSSVWRLFQTHAVTWRSRFAAEAEAGHETCEELDKKASQMTALRICQMLADPDADPSTIVSLARLELQRKALELAQQKHRDHERDETERALATLDLRASRDRYAQFILNELKAALERQPAYPSFFPIPPPLTEIVKNKPRTESQFAPPAPPA